MSEKELFVFNSAGNAALYYQVKPVTAFFLCLATWGLFPYWWHYQNWRLLKRNGMPAISPLFRSALHPFFAYALYDVVADTSKSLRLGGVFLLRVLGVVHLIVGLLPTAFLEPYFLGVFLSVIATFDLVIVQEKVKKINEVLGFSLTKKLLRDDVIALFLIGSHVVFLYLLYMYE